MSCAMCSIQMVYFSFIFSHNAHSFSICFSFSSWIIQQILAIRYRIVNDFKRQSDCMKMNEGLWLLFSCNFFAECNRIIRNRICGNEFTVCVVPTIIRMTVDKHLPEIQRQEIAIPLRLLEAERKRAVHCMQRIQLLFIRMNSE